MGDQQGNTKGKRVIPLVDTIYQAIPKRGLSVDTCKKFRYGVAQNDRGDWIQVANYGTEGQKWRSCNKDFGWFGSHPDTLFGQELWKQGGSQVVITEGEIDALSIYEACGDTVPVVSLPDGASSAMSSCKKNFEFLTSFQKIILCLDNDEPGKGAVDKLLGLFPVGQVYLTQLPLKDANDVLREHGRKFLRSLVLNAKPYRPDGIVNAGDLWDEIRTPLVPGYSYPWQGLTDVTHGVRTKELIVWGAGTGVGKTTILKQIALHLTQEHHKKVGCIFLEESNKHTVLNMMSMFGQRRVHLAGDEEDEGVLRGLFDGVTKGNLLSLYDCFGASSYEIIRDRVRYMVAVEGCEVVMLDHLTALTDGCSSDSDINQKMRNIVSTFAMMTQELDFCLHAISHLRKAQGAPHEEGGRVHLDDLYGAAALKQWANFVFGIERNQQAEEIGERNVSHIRCLKDRLTGQGLGSIIDLKYSPTKCILSEMGAFGSNKKEDHDDDLQQDF